MLQDGVKKIFNRIDGTDWSAVAECCPFVSVQFLCVFMNEDRALTVKDVAKRLNVSTQQVTELIDSGQLKAFEIGSSIRVMASEAQVFIERRQQEFARQHPAVAPDPSRFSVSQFSVEYSNFALHNISFSFPLGKIVSFLGPSGSGKTRLLKAIAGLERQTSGIIYFGETRLDLLEPKDRKLGFVFEDYALFPHLNARGNIEFPLKIGKHEKNVVRTEAAKRAQELQIQEPYLGIAPNALPEGIKQLVAIARSKNHHCELFLMDEPMSRLDAKQHIQLRLFLQKMLRDMEKTTIIAFNDPSDAMAISDYIGVIADGQLLQFGETWEIYHQPQTLLVMELTSRLGVNTLPVEIRNGVAHPYQIPAQRDDGAYLMAFRPEEITLAPNGIPADIVSAQILTANERLVSAEIGKKAFAQLVIPASAERAISFLPSAPKFFMKP